MSGVLILGAGGHGKVVADILLLCGANIIGFLDDDPQITGSTCLGLPVLGTINEYAQYAPEGLVLGIGSNQVRQAVVKRLGAEADHLWLNAVHPGATVAASAVLGKSVVIAAHAVVNPDSIVGDHVIINTASSIDHDCRISDFAHIAPGSHLAGGVVVEEGAFLGIGTAVRPGVSIGQWATVGAGSLVLRDVPASVTVYGVPAH
ncbi:MAG TPA: acetyltransferase [Abditibacteriaceae bacterium]|nr:acetyltransferase [Abditibacteriaceae bacterium]